MFSLKSFLSNCLRQVPFNGSIEFWNNGGKYVAASVACVLQVIPRNITCSNLAQLVGDIDAASTNCEVEMLFIRRAIRKNDVWSGHIAFPGGYLDGNENDFEACIREVKEEMSIDLESDGVFHLGKLMRRTFGQADRKVILPNVFIYFNLAGLVGHKTDIFRDAKLEPTEVVSYKWVNVQFFLDQLNSGKTSYYAMNVREFLPNKSEFLYSLLKYTLFDTVYFPCFYLPGESYLNSNTLSNDAQPWVLWGMTYTFVCNLLKLHCPEEQVRNMTHFHVNNALINILLKKYNWIYCRRLSKNETQSIHANSKEIVLLSICTYVVFNLVVISSGVVACSRYFI